MRKAGVAPDEVTFNTLINIAPDYGKAEHWYTEMRKAGVAPNEVTTISMATKCPDFETAQRLTMRLREDGAFRGQGYYCAVFAKAAPDADPAMLIAWYMEQDYKHPPSLEPIIRIFRSAERFDAAMEFVIRWPQLPAAKSFMIQCRTKFSREIGRLLDDQETRPSALYALGLFHFAHAAFAEAREGLTAALKFEMHEKRRAHIEKVLAQIDEAQKYAERTLSIQPPA
jgi:tetratricopeptide (TPR) repeat protein